MSHSRCSLVLSLVAVLICQHVAQGAPASTGADPLLRERLATAAMARLRAESEPSSGAESGAEQSGVSSSPLMESAPTDSSVCRLTSTSTWSSPTTMRSIESSPTSFPDDRNDHDQDLEQILLRIIEDEKNSIRQPKNYVSDELTAEEISQLFDSSSTESQAEESAGAGEASEGSSAQSPAGETSQPAQTEFDQPETTLATSTVKVLDPQLFVESEEEFERLKQSIKNDLLDRKLHPANFVLNDMEFEFLLKQLAENEDGIIDTRLKRWEKGQPMIFEPGVCPICHETMEADSEEDSKLSCGHDFHTGCIASYFRSVLRDVSRYGPLPNTNCPMCRRTVPMEELDRFVRN